MAITTITLAQAITGFTTKFYVSSTAGMVRPLWTSGSSTYLAVEQELMQLTDIPITGVVTVLRGVLGTSSSSHANGTGVAVGLAADFPALTNPKEIASGTVALGTAAIASGAQAATVTVTVPGVLRPTTSRLILTPTLPA